MHEDEQVHDDMHADKGVRAVEEYRTGWWDGYTAALNVLMRLVTECTDTDELNVYAKLAGAMYDLARRAPEDAEKG